MAYRPENHFSITESIRKIMEAGPYYNIHNIVIPENHVLHDPPKWTPFKRRAYHELKVWEGQRMPAEECDCSEECEICGSTDIVEGWYTMPLEVPELDHPAVFVIARCNRHRIVNHGDYLNKGVRFYDRPVENDND